MFSRIWHTFLDKSEPAVVLLIRVCGWSAIVFVFGIFLFIFIEGAPFLVNALRYHVDETRQAIVITRLPVENPEEITVERIEEAIHAGTLTGADKAAYEMVEGSVQVVVELKPGADAERVMRDLLVAFPMRQDRSHMLSFFTDGNWRPDSEVRPQFGILALILGTLSVTGLALLLSVPLGLAAAIYISEFCEGTLRETLKVIIEILAAIPSVVWGFIGYVVMNPLIQWVTGAPIGLNVLNGGIILALMSVPIIVSVGEDSLKAVPDTYREAALALGASRWQVIYKVLIPAAKNGLLAAVLLGIGRSIGETMAVLMATGHAVNIPHGVLDPVRTLTATIAAELGETVRGGPHYQSLFVIGMALMLIAFVVNLTADLVVKGIRGKRNA